MPSSTHRPAPEFDRLFRKFRGGDQAALAELVDRTQPWLRAVARRSGARGNEIDEVVQDAWVEATSPAAILPRDVPLLVWLASIVLHRFLRLRRDQMRWQRLHLVDGSIVDAAPTQQERGDVLAIARGNEVVGLVCDAIDQLDPTYGEVLRLHLFEGLSPLDVARRLRLSRVAVRVRLFRGIRQLRRRLPNALALLLFGLLGRTGAAQAPRWLGAGAAASLAVALALTFAKGGAAPPPSTAALAGVVATAPAVAGSVVDPAIGRSAPQLAAAAPSWCVRFHDADGRGIPAVGFVLAPATGSDLRLRTRRLASGVDGMAMLESLPAGPLALRTDRQVSVTIDGAGPPRQIDVRVPNGRTVRGRVVDGVGAPVPLATVWLASAADDALAGSDVLTTGADGTFVLTHLPAEVLVAARAPGRAPIVARRLAGDGEATLVLADVGSTITGMVLDAAGAPVADALVVVGAGAEGVSPCLALGLVPELPPPHCVRTDDRGEFAAVGVALGSLPVVVRSPGYAPCCLEVEVVADQPSRVCVRLEPGVVVRGRLVDRDSGAALAGAVACRADASFATSSVPCAEDGRFEFEAMPAGRLGLVAASGGGSVTEQCLLLEPGTHEVVIAVDPRRPCRGRLITTEAEALADWEVAAPATSMGNVPLGVPIGRTAADGTITLSVDPRAGWQHMLMRPIRSPLWLAARDHAWATADGGFEVRLPPALMPSARLQLCVRTDAGVPAAGAMAWLCTGSGANVQLGRFDHRGELEIGSLPGGTYQIVTEAPSPDVAPFDLAPIEVRNGERRRFEFAGHRPGKLEFSLHFADGSRPHAPMVRIEGSVPGLARARANTAVGSQVLLPGYYALVATGDDFVIVDDALVEVQPGQTAKLDRELRRAARRMISLQTLPNACLDSVLSGSFVDVRTGAVLGSFLVPTDEVVMRPLVAILPEGLIRFEATAKNGARVHAEFAVVGLTTDHCARQVVFVLDG